MEYTTLEFKVPVGSEQEFTDLFTNYLENYLSNRIKIVPPETQVEFEKEVDKARVENGLSKKFEKVVEDNLLEEHL